LKHRYLYSAKFISQTRVGGGGGARQKEIGTLAEMALAIHKATRVLVPLWSAISV
jgi:hypothetical protein